MEDGPMKAHVERDTVGVVKQEFIQYRKKNGMLVKESTVRNFQSNGDYNDSYFDEPLCKIGD